MKIKLIHGDIFSVKADAIVNPSNPQLLRGGGLCGIIHKAAGEELFEYLKHWKRECKRPALQFGEANISPSFNLPHKYIIQAVGAVWQGGDKGEAQLLENCYKNILRLCDKYQLKSVAIPNISTGIYGYPKEEAAKVAIETVKSFDEYSFVDEVVFVCYDQENFDIYNDILNL